MHTIDQKPETNTHHDAINENVRLRDILTQMGFDVDRLLSGPDHDHCRNTLLRHICLDENALQNHVGSEVAMEKWRASWSALRSR